MPKVSWKDKDKVIDFCQRINSSNEHHGLKSRCIVIQYEDRLNYNIVYRERKDLWDRSDVKVIWEQQENV